MAVQRKISAVWQYFAKEESDNKVVCWLCIQKLAYNHTTGAMRSHIQPRYLKINLQGEQATTSNTRQTSITTFVTQTHRRSDVDWSEKITQLITEMTARHVLPLCFVKGKSFRKFMHYIRSEYTVPSPTTKTFVTLTEQLFNVTSLTFVNCHVFFM